MVSLASCSPGAVLWGCLGVVVGVELLTAVMVARIVTVITQLCVSPLVALWHQCWGWVGSYLAVHLS